MKRTPSSKRALSPERREELLGILQARFGKNPRRHPGLRWADVKTRLVANVEKLWSLGEMEKTGGEPDVVGQDKTTGEYLFGDCSPQSPEGRTSVCYDREGLESRKEHKPKTSAMEMAAAMGVELLTEEQYRELQQLGGEDERADHSDSEHSGHQPCGGGAAAGISGFRPRRVCASCR